MANIKLKFLGTVNSGHNSELELYLNEENEIYINIESPDGQYNFICLDKSTAIKLSKVLRTEINKMEDSI